jgi:hypothetical protein
VLLGELAFPCPAAADRVDQGQALVELGVVARRLDRRAVERLELLAANRALGVWPDREIERTFSQLRVTSARLPEQVFAISNR